MDRQLYSDPSQDVFLGWKEILAKIKTQEVFYSIQKSQQHLDVFLQMVCSLIVDEPIILLENDIPLGDVEKIGIEKNQLGDKAEINWEKLPSTFEEFLDNLTNLKKWKITLFTSGTTGQPKKVVHNFESITKGVKLSQKYSEHKWGWAYNPTHMAGIQVFFQALLNENTLVPLFSKSRQEIISNIRSTAITHISATPSFYRMLLPLETELPSITTITFGGERLDKNLEELFRTVFPNAKLRNVYASTEAGALFSTEGEFFKVSDRLSKYVKFVDNQLLIHQSLLGEFQMNADEWYNTGDIVEFSTHSPKLFRFISRNSEVINVGGYNVNPQKVEQELNKHPKVINSLVYGKSNSILGRIVMAEVKTDSKFLTEKELRSFLTGKLQSYEVPRIFKFVDELPLTKTGKILRKR